ncbi:Integrator complex subunit 2, partial [Coemansia sp. RSA 1933]
RLDDLFCTSGSYLWIDPPASRTRSKYAQPGIELYERVCSHFFAQGNTGNDNKQRQAPQFMRVVSGLIGFLRLEANEAFLDAFKRTECFALEPSTADISASLLLVLVGCGSQIPANDILNAVSGITNPLVAARIDSLIAHLLTDHVKPVAEFVNKSLGMDFAYPHERLFYFKDAVLQSKLSHFSGAAIAKRLISKDYAKTEDTSPCCSHLQSTAILYFLQAEVFQENGIDIREWFSALIGDMDAAVADGFSVVVKAYVSAIFNQLDAVAVLQHELSVDALQQTSYKSLASEPHIPRKCPPPFQLVETFLKLKSEAHGLFKHATTDLPGERTRDEQLMLLLSTIEQYFKYPVPVRMETCGAFSGYLCRIALQNCADDEIVASICQAWFSLHELNPHIVSTATANSWRTKVETAKPKLAPQDIWLDPLVLFRSDSRVFESPGLTDILLTVLAEFLVLSRTCMYRIHSLRQRDNCAVKRPHVVALVQLQESSALQILIELASLSRNDAVRALIFEFIHARFLEQRVVQKLVHFQAYGLGAIDDMVKNVPSMHACSEFIPEMLMQSTPRLQLFSVKLAASITANYPIAANEGMTKEVILPHIQTTLTQIAGTVAADQLAISNAMLEAVIRINHAFPLIRQDCTRLIQAVQNAAIEKVQTVFQDTQQQSDLVQNTAKWVGSCDKVLKVIDNANTEEDRLHFTQIEDISPDDFVSMVESAMKPREKNKHFGSKPPTSSSAEPGSTTAHQQGVATSILPPVGLPTHPPPGQTLTPFNTSLPNPQQPHGSGSGPIPGNQKRSHGTAMDSPAEFGRGRGGPFVNTGGALRGPPPSATGQQLPDLAGQGNAVMYAHLQPAQMAAGSLGTHGPAGFKKRPRQRSRPPGGKDMNGGKAAAISMKRSAKVPGGDRQQRTKDH